MRNLAPSGGTTVPAEAHECAIPAGLCAPLTSPPSHRLAPDLTPDARACLDDLATAAADADAAGARLNDALSRYHAIFGPPELAPGPDGAMRRNPAAVAFHAERAAAPPPPPPDRPDLLGYDDAAARLGIRPRTLRKIVAEGALRPVRIRGRVLFAPASLDAYARACVSGAACKPAGRPGARRSATPHPVATPARTFSPARVEARR